jgi:hypothetical protein
MTRMKNPICSDLNPAFNPRHLRAMSFLVITCLASGCGDFTATRPPPPADVPVVAIGTNHDPATCGRIAGTVMWAGEFPIVTSLTIDSLLGRTAVPNPHAPAIDRRTKRLGGAVVFLRGVDPAKSKPAGPSCVGLNVRDTMLTFREGGRVGFVRHGEWFGLSNDGAVSHAVRGRGALSFAVPLPAKGTALSRIASRPGIVHLTSGSNIAPASAYLFVCEHPYFAVTNADGTFAFDAVPDGDYDLVLWHPNWNVLGHDRNPETGLINRYHYGEPFEKVSRVTAMAGGLTTVSLSFP